MSCESTSFRDIKREESTEMEDSIAALLCSMSKGTTNMNSAENGVLAVPNVAGDEGRSTNLDCCEGGLPQQQQQHDFRAEVDHDTGTDQNGARDLQDDRRKIEAECKAIGKAGHHQNRRSSSFTSCSSPSSSSSEERARNRQTQVRGSLQAKVSSSGYTSVTTTAEGISESETDMTSFSSKKKQNVARANNSLAASKSASRPSYSMDRELLGAPYFYYRNRSLEIDEDPLAPLSPPLSVPNFVIKLHSILIREDLRHIACWVPHGRSWKIVDAEAFEKEVLPAYFKQSSINSFHRQANGWGFRRMLKGPDKGAFYNEWFLRGLSYLCKKMKRIGGAKVFEDANISHEPNLWKISARYPLPEEPTDDMNFIVLKTINECVQKEGPKAKMPFIHDLKKSRPSPPRSGGGSTGRNEERNRSDSNLSNGSHGSVPNDIPKSIQLQAPSPSNTSSDLFNLVQPQPNGGNRDSSGQQIDPAQLQQLTQLLQQNQSAVPQVHQVAQLNTAQNHNDQSLANMLGMLQDAVQQGQQQQDQRQQQFQQIAQILMQNEQQNQQQQQFNQQLSLQSIQNTQIQQGNLLANLFQLSQNNQGQPQAQPSLIPFSSNSNGNTFQQQMSTNGPVSAPAPSSFMVTNPVFPNTSCSQVPSQMNSSKFSCQGNNSNIGDALQMLINNINPNDPNLSLESIVGMIQNTHGNPQQQGMPMHQNNQDQVMQYSNMTQVQSVTQAVPNIVQQTMQSQNPQAVPSNGSVSNNSNSQQAVYDLVAKAVLSGMQLGAANVVGGGGQPQQQQQQQWQQAQQQTHQQQNPLSNIQSFQPFNHGRWM